MQSQSSTTVSKVLLAPHFYDLNSEQRLGPKDQYLGNTEKSASDETLQVTGKTLGAMGEKPFWFTDSGTSSIVVTVGSVAILVCVVGLVWKYLRRSSGMMGAKSGSVPPPELDTTDDDGIYRHELGIYNSINEGSGFEKDKRFCSSSTNTSKKLDPFVIGTEYTQCSSCSDTPLKSRNRSISDGQGSPI